MVIDITMGDRIDLYDIVKDYHRNNNLETIVDGMKNPLKMKSEESSYHSGICILQNGSTLIDRLKEEGRIDEIDIYDGEKIDGNESWKDFLSRIEMDGVYIYESKSQMIYRIRKIRDGSLPSTSYKDLLPADFFYHGDMTEKTEKEMRYRLGTKTQLALDIARQYTDITVTMIKKTINDDKTKSGKVVEIGANGLQREYAIIGKEDGIYGVSREYKNGPTKGRAEKEEYLSPYPRNVSGNLDISTVGGYGPLGYNLEGSFFPNYMVDFNPLVQK